MDYELPTEFDLIIMGTGVVESVVSAAASRIGKQVLHIDSNNYYGGLWASFNLDAFQKLNETSQLNVTNENRVEGEKVLPVGNQWFGIKDFYAEWHVPDKIEIPVNQVDVEVSETENVNKEPELEVNSKNLIPDEAPVTQWSQELLLKDSRKFNLDLAPKLQFARGDFVELLISSNIARYSEYRSVSRVLTWLNGQLEIVPCSRSDVFANNKVSVIEKRMLMKLFTSLDNDEKELLDGTNETKTFRSFLKDKKLTPNLIHYVLYAISMSTDDTLCLEGIQNTKRFLNSLGRFGKTPFLFSMYGSGEIAQGFCRLSAVFGGVYALNQSLNGLTFDEQNNFKSLICGKQEIKSKTLVLGAEKCPTDFIKTTPKSYISRAVFITDSSIMPNDKEHLTLLIYPPEHERDSVVFIELGTLTGTCPKNLYIVHLITRQITNPKDDLQGCTCNLFGTEDKPRILWSSYFSIPDSNDMDLNNGTPRNLFVCPGPDLDLDFDNSVKKARDIFNQVYPDCEFLPRAPDPEEIIIEGEETPENDKSIIQEQKETKLSEKTEVDMPPSSSDAI